MKYRIGFVSNSSSSSFIVSKDNLTEVQRLKLFEIAGPNGWGFSVKETEQFIVGRTIMDNLNIKDYLKKIKIPSCEYHVDTHFGWVFEEFLKEALGEEPTEKITEDDFYRRIRGDLV